MAFLMIGATFNRPSGDATAVVLIQWGGGAILLVLALTYLVMRTGDDDDER